MIDSFPPTYLRHRLLEERELAKSAACVEAREAHAKLAILYETRLSSGDGDRLDTSDIGSNLKQTIAAVALRPGALV